MRNLINSFIQQILAESLLPQSTALSIADTTKNKKQIVTVLCVNCEIMGFCFNDMETYGIFEQNDWPGF